MASPSQPLSIAAADNDNDDNNDENVAVVVVCDFVDCLYREILCSLSILLFLSCHILSRCLVQSDAIKKSKREEQAPCTQTNKQKVLFFAKLFKNKTQNCVARTGGRVQEALSPKPG